MIESNFIEWLDFGDSSQIIDVYAKEVQIRYFRFFRNLIKNKSIPILINVIFIFIFFIQICTICIINVTGEKEFLLDILNYLNRVTTLFQIINNPLTYKKLFLILFIIILFDFILTIITFYSIKKINTSYLCFIINLLNLIICYYLIGPAVEISLTSLWCEYNYHKYLRVTCFSNSTHLMYIILSFIMLLLYLFISFIYSFYINEIEIIQKVYFQNTTRIECNYEIYCLICKVSIFIFSFFFYKIDYEEELHLYIKIIYEGFIFIICLFMSIYTYKKVYFYNKVINNIIHIGWYLCSWFSMGIILKSLLNINGISNFISIGWVIIILAFYKAYILEENLLLTKSNIFEFNDINLIEKYKNILLNKLSEENDNKSKVFILGLIKKFEDFASNNPEIYYQYQKLINDEKLIKKFHRKDFLSIISIIYTMYSFYYEKSSNKEYIVFHLSYFLINKFNNVSYAIFLCSKLKSKGHKIFFYKYLLVEDIKEYLILKLKKKSKKESIRKVQLGAIILYYLYVDIFKLKIYDSICNQIDYFDLLKSNVTTNKSTENFLKSGENIFKTHREIKTVWEKLVEINPFCDECYRDYMLYLESIIQDEILVNKESKNYMIIKNNKSREKYNIYHSMFILDTSAILLVDGYLTTGKILYASPNFSYLFMFSGKELMSLSIDDILPNIIQPFHKELIDHAIRYSNINHIFKQPRDSLLKNKTGGLLNIKLFVKPVPNLYYGLIYFCYIQKIHEPNFNIILDKDLKINGFTEMPEIGSTSIIHNKFNLDPNIIGYHIGLIIPDIFFLLEFNNEELSIIKTDFEFKGNLYSIKKEKNMKIKIDAILDKIKGSQINMNKYQEQIKDDPNNIIQDLNNYIMELKEQKIESFSIFYKIKEYNFIDGKYKYYRIYINNDIMSGNEFCSKIEKLNTNSQNDKKNNTELKRSNSNKSKESKNKRKIKLKIEEINSKNKVSKNANNDNNIIGINNNEKNYDENQESSNKNIDNIDEEQNDNQNILFQYNPIQSNNYISNNILKEFNKIKNEIINKKETLPLKIMKYLCYIFAVVTIILMIIEFLQQKASFNRLAFFLSEHLYFNELKINVGVLYIICLNIRWLSHSLYINGLSYFNEEWSKFHKKLLEDNIAIMEVIKSTISSNYEFKDIINKRYQTNIYFYKLIKNYKYNLNDLFYYMVNCGIKLMNSFDYFIQNDCNEIPKELGLKEINLKNLIEQSYYFYNLNLSIYTIDEIRKNKSTDKNFFYFPFALTFSGLILIFLLIFFIYYIISLYHIEIFFLEKLINFNSSNFDNYIKHLDEIKKKLRNDNNEEEEKGDDIDIKEEEDGEGNDNITKNQTKQEKKLKTKKKKKIKKVNYNNKKKINYLK